MTPANRRAHGTDRHPRTAGMVDFRTGSGLQMTERADEANLSTPPRPHGTADILLRDVLPYDDCGSSWVRSGVTAMTASVGRPA